MITKEEFDNWIESYKQNNLCIDVPADWYDDVVATHPKLIEKFGGFSKIEMLTLEDEDLPISQETLDSFRTELNAIIPDYFEEFKDRVEFSEMNREYIKTGKFAKTKWGRHIARFMRNKYDETARQNVAGILSRLGEAWATAKSKADKFYVIMSCDPRAFIKMGNYFDVDTKSCFGPGAGNEFHKYYLGSDYESFVILVKKEPGLHDFHEKDFVARTWGFWDIEGESMVTSNRYIKAGVFDGNIEKVVTKFIKNNFDLPLTTNTVRIEGVYGNGDAKYYSKKEENSSPRFQVEPTGIAKSLMTKCKSCGLFDFVGTYADTGEQYCYRCGANFPRCFVSKKRTKKWQLARDSNNKERFVSDKYIAELEKCYYSNNLYLKQDMLRCPEGYNISKFNVRKYGYRIEQGRVV